MSISLLEKLAHLGRVLPPSHQVNYSEIPAVLSALVHYAEHGPELLKAIETEDPFVIRPIEETELAVLEFLTSHAERVNKAYAEAHPDASNQAGVISAPVVQDLQARVRELEAKLAAQAGHPAEPPVQEPAPAEAPPAAREGAPLFPPAVADTPGPEASEPVAEEAGESPSYQELVAELQAANAKVADLQRATVTSEPPPEEHPPA